MHFEAIIKDKQTYGPFSCILVVAEDKQEAEDFARRIYKEKLIEVKEMF